MTPLASLLLARGERVTGSDGPLYPPMSDRLAALGINVLPAFRAENVGADVSEVVAGNLARRDNPEILEALRRGLNVRSMPETPLSRTPYGMVRCRPPSSLICCTRARQCSPTSVSPWRCGKRGASD